MGLRRELGLDIEGLLKRQASYIAECQLPSGAIPRHVGGMTDTWCHIACAIALDLCRQHTLASRAYRWLSEVQNADGSWWSSYSGDQPGDLTRDSNYCSYLAVGLWYHYLTTLDSGFLHTMWPTLEKGIAFTLRLQQPTGEIYWAYDPNDTPYPLSLLAASSCIWKSLDCGLRIARMVGQDKPDWALASQKLAQAMMERPQLFARSGDGITDYAMNWYYPVLTGVIGGHQAEERVRRRWADFIVEEWGCKCTAEEPCWVTVAETGELIVALNRIGEDRKARLLLDWILKLQDTDGCFWTGIKLPEKEVWPRQEKFTWVSAAVVMAVTAQFRGQIQLR